MIYHTHKAIEHMTAAGVPLAQAEAIAEAVVMLIENKREQEKQKQAPHQEPAR